MIVWLDDRAGRHLALAVGRYWPWARANGLDPPAELLEFAEHLAKSVTVRQEATWLVEPGGVVDGRVVAEPLLLTYAQAAERLGVSRRTVERLVAAGDLMGTRVGGAARIRATDLAAYVEGLGPRPFRRQIQTKETA